MSPRDNYSLYRSLGKEDNLSFQEFLRAVL